MKQLNFGAAPSTSRTSLVISSFRGEDLTNAPANVDDRRSPNAPNMMRDQPGKVKKRTGYQLMQTYDGRINGVHFLKDPNGEDVRLLHVGTKLYAGSEVVYEDMADGRSTAWQMGGKVWILDGKTYLCYDGETCQPVRNIATVPEIRIACKPATGEGQTFEPVNLLSPKRMQGYIADGETKTYALAYDDLSDEPVVVSQKQEDGSWIDYTEGGTELAFTVDRAKGTVTFNTAPKMLVEGQDNIRITFGRASSHAIIDSCIFSITYGVRGASNQLFVSGNEAFPNRDWYCKIDDPTFFGDVWYHTLGQDDSRVIGYSIVNNYLVTHKDGSVDGRNIIIRSGTLTEESEPSFPIYTTLNGAPAISSYAFGFLGGEPLFLTPQGVQAITAQDVTGEKYANSRSFYINRPLEELPLQTLADAFALVWRDFYLLAVGDRVYLLDGLQKEYSRNTPMSAFQYECYHWEGINARVLWEEGGALWFGKENGEVCRFYEDDGTLTHFNDNGAAIEAFWELPDFDGKTFYRNKTVRYIAVKLASAVATGVDIYALVRGMWKRIVADSGKAVYFDWSQLNWSKFTFQTDSTPRTLGKKIKIKKVDKVRFRLVNDKLDEPFGLYEIGIEHTEQGYYRR